METWPLGVTDAIRRATVQVTPKRNNTSDTIPQIIRCLQTMTTSETKDPQSNSEVMSAARDLKGMCEQGDFVKKVISQVRASCPDFVKKIPDFERALDALGHIPLDRLSSPREVLTFVEALIESGIASQSEKGLVFVLGNTNCGKTSLVNTFKDFVDNPAKELTPTLTHPGDSLIETQVLEVYDSLTEKPEKAYKVDHCTTSNAPRVINLEEIKDAVVKDAAGLQLKIVDLGRYDHRQLYDSCLYLISNDGPYISGGHQEYFAASTLFMASSGLFLVCFDSSSLKPQGLGFCCVS